MSTSDEAKINSYIRKVILAAIFFGRLEGKNRLKMKVKRQRLPARLGLTEA